MTLTVTDDDGLTSNITRCVDVLIANFPPEVEIFGPNRGKPDVEYEYGITVTDPDDDGLYIWIDWGDGDSIDWLGPLVTGEPVKLSHVWNQTGTYVIKVKVKDDCSESEWIEIEITIPRTRASSYLWYHWLFEHFLMLKKLLNLII